MTGMSTTAARHEPKRVIVIGGSIAGQLAAAAFARNAFDVVILDRDQFPDEAVPRKGLPQSRHAHVLLCSGQQVLDGLLPAVSERLSNAGAEMLDWTQETAIHSLAGWHQPHSSNLKSLFMSRDLLDMVVRRAVAELGVKTLSGHEVVALTSGVGKAVTGVRFRRRDASEEPEVALEADLVVDASGRDSKAPDWLNTLGFEKPRELLVDPLLGYATRVYRRPQAGLAWKGMVARSRTSMTRAGAISPIEDNRWLVTLAGFSKDYPPQDDAGFLDFADSIGVPELAAAIRAAEPLTQAVGYRRTTNRWRLFQEMKLWPENFIVVGDAFCAFNPYYGQGMSVAAMSALALHDMLAEASPAAAFATRAQRRLAGIVGQPWLMATTEECRYPETQGAARGWQTRLNLWFTDRLVERATHDLAVMDSFISVAHLVRPFTVLMRPRILLPVLLRPRVGAKIPPPRLAPQPSPASA